MALFLLFPINGAGGTGDVSNCKTCDRKFLATTNPPAFGAVYVVN